MSSWVELCCQGKVFRCKEITERITSIGLGATTKDFATLQNEFHGLGVWRRLPKHKVSVVVAVKKSMWTGYEAIWVGRYVIHRLLSSKKQPRPSLRWTARNTSAAFNRYPKITRFEFVDHVHHHTFQSCCTLPYPVELAIPIVESTIEAAAKHKLNFARSTCMAAVLCHGREPPHWCHGCHGSGVLDTLTSSWKDSNASTH